MEATLGILSKEMDWKGWSHRKEREGCWKCKRDGEVIPRVEAADIPGLEPMNSPPLLRELRQVHLLLGLLKRCCLNQGWNE